MDSKHRIDVPLRSGGKKMRKRRELDALIAHSIAKRTNRRAQLNGAANSQDKLLSASTDDPEDYAWTNFANAGRRRPRKYAYFRMCGPLLFILGAGLLIGIMYWLYFDLRQQIYDYRQKIEEVSATSQNLPDTLQKWHETSSYLIRNQSTILTRINDMQKSIETLRSNFSTLKASVETPQNYAKDEKLVADFGAKIEAIATDVESIKEHYNTNIEQQKNMQAVISKMKENLTTLENQPSQKLPANYTEEINVLKSTLSDNLKGLETDLGVVNDTLSQKSKMLRDELATHKIKLDELIDRSENITSHVTTISNNCAEYRQKIINFDTTVSDVMNEISLMKNQSNKLEYSLENLSNLYKTKIQDMTVKQITKNNTDIIPTTIQVAPAAVNESKDNNNVNSENRTTIMP